MKKLLFLGFISFFGTKPSQNQITYRQLTWEDFQGAIPADESDAVGAKTFTHIEMHEGAAKGKYLFDVKAYFLVDSSFCRRERVNPAALRHEQMHFLITHIMALKCNRALGSLQHCDPARLPEAYRIFNLYADSAESINLRFDAETDRYNNPFEENIWEIRLTQNLQELVKDLN